MAQEAALCLLIRTSYQNLIARHLRNLHQIVKEGTSMFYIGDLTMIFIQTRTSYKNPRRTVIHATVQSICKTLMQGPLEDDFNRIFTRSSHNDLYEIMQGPLKGFQGSLQELLTRNCKRDQDLHAKTPDRIPLDRHKRTCCCVRGSYKILAQELLKRIPEELSKKHLQYMASAKSSRRSYRDLRKIFC